MKKLNVLLLLGMLNAYSTYTIANDMDMDREKPEQEMNVIEMTDKQKNISAYFMQQINASLRTFSEVIDAQFKDELAWLQTNYSDDIEKGDEYINAIMEELRSFLQKTIDSIKSELENAVLQEDEVTMVQELYNNMNNNIPGIIEQATKEFKKQLRMHNELVKMNKK